MTEARAGLRRAHRACGRAFSHPPRCACARARRREAGGEELVSWLVAEQLTCFAVSNFAGASGRRFNQRSCSSPLSLPAFPALNPVHPFLAAPACLGSQQSGGLSPRVVYSHLLVPKVPLMPPLLMCTWHYDSYIY